MHKEFALTLSCPNRPGIVAAVATYLFENQCNILDAQQFDELESNRFFMRVLFNPVSDTVALDALKAGFASVADPFGMVWTMRDRAERRRVMILVSKFDHCLADLLYRWRSGELP
ncbi:MAG TPA: ACT domain-containing protein, partial [Pedomonas sp.]|uniref:ACT domain-containing protein n=1 Tax=Pedomonas sp. TaxID=2976421 RepID=UPI002F3F1092